MPEPHLIGKYEIIEELGRGGFAVVYKARDPKLKREVALKVLHESHARRADVVQRFLDEASRAASLNHPGIVHINEVDEYNGQPFIAMDYLPGGTLLAYRLRGEPLPVEGALLILVQLAAALDYAHKRSLIHRDVKPANILFNEDDRAVLVDFGLVKSLIDSGYTMDGTSLGTPQYMSPEQARGEIVDARSDVYALGIVAYEMFTGHVPFQADTPLAVVNAQINFVPPDPRQANTKLNESISAALLKALSKTPADRYDSAGAFVAALHVAHEESVHKAQQKSELAQLIAQVQAARQAKNWSEVHRLCVQIMQVDRAHPDLPQWLTEATTEFQRENAEEAIRRQRIRRYEEGEAALNVGQWQTAIVAFEEVAQGNPDFREVQQNLTIARDELQRGLWYDEAIARGEAQQWPEAASMWLKVLQGRMDYHGGDAALRLTEAVRRLLDQWMVLNETLVQSQQDLGAARRALGDFDALSMAMNAHSWTTAIELVERLLKVNPDLQQPGVWLTAARRELETATARSKTPAVQVPFPESVAKLLSADRLTWLTDGKEMVRVLAGEFLYGEDKQKLNLPEFWIDKTPVTNAEYARFVAATKYAAPQHWKGQSPVKEIAEHPVVNVSHEDATAYAKWAGKRLPSEQEWEKAARGTDGRTYPWGDQQPTDKLCNFGQNIKGTTSVGKYSPQGDSPYGCLDMAGNVWEWTASDYNDANKVLRGGSWSYDASIVRTAYRSYNTPDSRHGYLGFRCVAAPGE